MFRIDPAGPASAYKTYAIRCLSDRTVVAACEQVGCLAWAYGWETTIDERTELGARQAAHIRHRSGRTYREQRTDAGLTVFRFEPRQRCFDEHRTRPEFYSVRAGDWRAHLGLIRRHTRPADWVEDFGEHQNRVAAERAKKG
jgi:hypothetical protein